MLTDATSSQCWTPRKKTKPYPRPFRNDTTETPFQIRVCVCVYRVPYCSLKHIRLLLTCYLGMVFAPWSGYLARSSTQDQGSNQVTTTTISISVYVQILGWGKGRGKKLLKNSFCWKQKSNKPTLWDHAALFWVFYLVLVMFSKELTLLSSAQTQPLLSTGRVSSLPYQELRHRNEKYPRRT